MPSSPVRPSHYLHKQHRRHSSTKSLSFLLSSSSSSSSFFLPGDGNMGPAAATSPSMYSSQPLAPATSFSTSTNLQVPPPRRSTSAELTATIGSNASTLDSSLISLGSNQHITPTKAAQAHHRRRQQPYPEFGLGGTRGGDDDDHDDLLVPPHHAVEEHSGILAASLSSAAAQTSSMSSTLTPTLTTRVKRSCSTSALTALTLSSAASPRFRQISGKTGIAQPALDFSNSHQGDFSSRSRSSSASTLSELVLSSTMSSPGYTSSALPSSASASHAHAHAHAGRPSPSRPVLANLISTLTSSLPSASTSSSSSRMRAQTHAHVHGVATVEDSATEELLSSTSASSSALSSPVSSIPPATPTSNNVSPHPSPSLQMHRSPSGPFGWSAFKISGHAHHSSSTANASTGGDIKNPSALEKQSSLSPPPPKKRSRSNTVAGLPSAIAHASEKLASATGLGLTFGGTGSSSSQNNASSSYTPRKGTVPLPLRHVASFARMTGLATTGGSSSSSSLRTEQQQQQQHTSGSQPQTPKSPRSLLGQLAFVPPQDGRDEGEETPCPSSQALSHQQRQGLGYGHYRRGSLTAGMMLGGGNAHYAFSDFFTPGPLTASSSAYADMSHGPPSTTTTSSLPSAPPYTPLTPQHTPYIEHISVSYNPTSACGAECKKLLMRLERFKKRSSLDMTGIVNSNNVSFPPPTAFESDGSGVAPGKMSRSSSGSGSGGVPATTPSTPGSAGSQSFKVIAKIRDVPDQNKIEVTYIDGFKLAVDATGLSHTQLLEKIGLHAHVIAKRQSP